jgi:hypothetical protein
MLLLVPVRDQIFAYVRRLTEVRKSRSLYFVCFGSWACAEAHDGLLPVGRRAASEQFRQGGRNTGEDAVSKPVDEMLASIALEWAECKSCGESLEAKSLFRLLNVCPPGFDVLFPGSPPRDVSLRQKTAPQK